MIVLFYINYYFAVVLNMVKFIKKNDKRLNRNERCIASHRIVQFSSLQHSTEQYEKNGTFRFNYRESRPCGAKICHLSVVLYKAILLHHVPEKL